MNILTDWFAQLDPSIRPYWVVAIVASVVFLIQMVMTFVGIGDADGVDMDFDLDADADGGTLDAGGTLQLFSVRNIINFLLGAGWGGVCFAPFIGNPFLLAATALLVGCLFVAVFAFVYKQMRHLEHDGAFRIEECMGQVADAYSTPSRARCRSCQPSQMARRFPAEQRCGSCRLSATTPCSWRKNRRR